MVACCILTSNTKKGSKCKAFVPFPTAVATIVGTAHASIWEGTSAKADNHMAAEFLADNPLSFLADDKLNTQKWQVNGYGEAQLSYQKAYTYANKVLGLPTTWGLLHRCKETRWLYGWIHNTMEMAKFEADLTLVNSVKEMTWIPTQNVELHYQLPQSSS